MIDSVSRKDTPRNGHKETGKRSLQARRSPFEDLGVDPGVDALVLRILADLLTAPE